MQVVDHAHAITMIIMETRQPRISKRRPRASSKAYTTPPANPPAQLPRPPPHAKAPRPAANGMLRSLLLPVLLVLLVLPRPHAFVTRLRQDGSASRVPPVRLPVAASSTGTLLTDMPSSTSLGAARVIDTHASSSSSQEGEDENARDMKSSALTTAAVEKQARIARREARRRRKQQALLEEEGKDDDMTWQRGGGGYMLPALSSSSTSPTSSSSRSALMHRRELPLLPKGGGLDATTSSSTRPHTVDLYVPSADLEVMLSWADKLEALPALSSGSSSSSNSIPLLRRQHKQLLFLDKEQRLLALAQMVLGMEKLRREIADARRPGTAAVASASAAAAAADAPVTSRELAARLGLTTEKVEAFYKLGLRARSYILMSMHSLILSLARKYAGTFGVDQAELVQEGYRGAMQAVERYDGRKAGGTGATFRGFAYVYVMSAMITAARNELHLGAAPLGVRDPDLMRLGSGEEGGGREGGGGRGLLLPSRSVGEGTRARTRGALPLKAVGRGGGGSGGQLALTAVSSAAAAGVGLLRGEKGEGDSDDDGYDSWGDKDRDEYQEEDDEDEEEAAEAARGRKPTPQVGRRRKVRPMRRMMTRMTGPAHEAMMEAGSVGRSLGRSGGGGGSSSSNTWGRRAELFGVDPEAARPAYELVDESKRARDLNRFLKRAAAELPERDMQVLSLVYGLEGQVPMKKAQVAAKLGMSVAVVNKSERRALNKLREMLNIKEGV